MSTSDGLNQRLVEMENAATEQPCFSDCQHNWVKEMLHWLLMADMGHMLAGFLTVLKHCKEDELLCNRRL